MPSQRVAAVECDRADCVKNTSELTEESTASRTVRSSRKDANEEDLRVNLGGIAEV